MYNSSTNQSFELLSSLASTANKDNARNNRSKVLNNITCRITSGNSCNICLQDHSTSSHAEISLLLKAVPQLGEVFTIKQKIGEGTFSCVYLAMVKHASPGFLNSKSHHEYVALKHIVPTSLPGRILVELECMHKFGVHPNIIGINSCLRQGQHVVMVMPYFQHDRFTDYVNQLDIGEISSYMLNLLDALRFIHRGGIIHRDIKPSNFLYNRKLKRFALVDFGLAQRASKIDCSASSSLPSIAGLKVRHGESGKDASKFPLTNGFQGNNEHQFLEQKANKSFMRLLPVPANSLGSSQSASHHQLTIRSSDISTPITKSSDERSLCECKGRPQVCRVCLSKPVQSASRAGTPGFRPPEVLLKHPHQTTAVDIWSAGVIFVCLLSGRYPFFHGNDDLTALAEITTLFGTATIKAAALKLGKCVQCAPEKPSIDLRTLCETLRSEIKEPIAKTEKWSIAYDLLTKMLDVNPNARIAASTALQHSFFALKPHVN